MLRDIVSEQEVLDIIRRALQEDIGSGDVTSLALVDSSAQGRAVLYPRKPCVLAGATIAARVFQEVDASLQVRPCADDGAHLEAEQPVLEVKGNARGILAAERVALNFLQRLTGIATLTFEYVRRAGKMAVLDTRKTTPTLRLLEKYAVVCGGGANHRFGLFDRILIKDNHRAIWRQGGRSLADAVRSARQQYPGLLVEVEVESEDDLKDVLQAAPDWVLLDNMSVENIARCVEICRGTCKVEVSGNVTLDTVAAIARTGADAVSIGALTHSAAAIDLTLEWMRVE